MSIDNIGYKDERGWQLIERRGKVEMWHNGESDNYGVYLYEHVQRDEHWLLFAIRPTKEAADEVFDKVVGVLRQRLSEFQPGGSEAGKGGIMAKGTIRQLITDRGYGFIQTGERTDLFFHRSELAGARFAVLKEGQEVEFEMGKGPDDRPQAVRVRLAQAKGA